MPREDGQFKKGNQFGRNPGGRPKKPEWLKGKGEEALKKAYEIMTGDNKPELVLQAARMLVEYDLGKPQQSVDLNADVSADATVSVLETMSLKKRGEAIQKAIEVYEKAK